MTLRRAAATVVLLTAGFVALVAEPAMAHCHLFSVSANPASVSEGGFVTVRVSRDGPDGNGQVTVKSVAGTAASGTDFAPLTQTVSFVQGQTSKTFNVSTVEDTLIEGDERFRVRLSNVSGDCTPPPVIAVQEATVTIQNDDAAPTTTTTRPATTTTASTTTTTASSSTTSSTEASSSTTEDGSSTTSADDVSSTSPDSLDETTTTELAQGETVRDDRGGGSWLLPLVLGLILAVALGGALFARHRLADNADDAS